MNPVDEINDNIPCPECGQDPCICDINEVDYFIDVEDSDDEESEDEIIP
jgi:hypothetical protein